MSKKIRVSKIHRAWCGRVVHINNFLTWCKDHGIMSEREANTYSNRCWSYYRYFNDGDYPRFMNKWCNQNGFSYRYANSMRYCEWGQKAIRTFDLGVEEVISDMLLSLYRKYGTLENRIAYYKHVEEVNRRYGVA